MGRIQRLVITADSGNSLDLASVGSGKLFIQNIGTEDVLVSYIRNPDGNAITVPPYAQSYYTIMAGQAYTFDISPSTGKLAQDQQMFFYSVNGTTVEIWVAN
jgi:hypothetical protein